MIRYKRARRRRRSNHSRFRRVSSGFVGRTWSRVACEIILNVGSTPTITYFLFKEERWLVSLCSITIGIVEFVVFADLLTLRWKLRLGGAVCKVSFLDWWNALQLLSKGAREKPWEKLTESEKSVNEATIALHCFYKHWVAGKIMSVLLIFSNVENWHLRFNKSSKYS